jgi:hypothetical protein
MLFGLLPMIAFPQRSIPSLSSRIVGGFVRTTMIIAIGSIVWTKLGLFTWLIAVLVYLTGLGIGWMSSHQWQQQAKFQQFGQRIAIATVDIFDQGLSMKQLRRWFSLPWQFIYRSIYSRIELYKFNLPLITLIVVSVIAILVCTIWLRFDHPVTEFRFSHPDTYQQLLITQQILARDFPVVDHLPVFSGLAAFIAAMSGVHAVSVVHLLGAIIGTLLVLSIGYTIRYLTKNGAAALAASYSLGVYLFTWNLPISNHLPPAVQQCLVTIRDSLNNGLIRSWAVSELELGALFAILAIGCSTHIIKPAQRREAIVNTLCCICLVAVISPSLLIIVLCGGFGTIFGRQMALFAIATSWTGLGIMAAIPGNNFSPISSLLETLPIGLSLMVGLLFVAIAAGSRLLLANWSAPICLMVYVAITCNFLLPLPPPIDYLEYDAAARKAVEIGHLFHRHQWTVVAPIEQLSQVYGRGWYEDAAEFTTKYQDLVADPSFHFPQRTTLLIFTENRPFTNDKPEYPVTYSVLTDPTYRNYRSLSGRIKLQIAMQRLCETYRRQHHDSRIYYENDRLRIYQFAPQSKQP